MISRCLLALSALVCVSCDVSHILAHEDHLEVTTTTEPPPPRPYAFAYTAGRFHDKPDRHHAEVSDGSGTVKGTFSYVDPRQKVRRVDYIADKNGFRPILSENLPEHPADSEAVAIAKERHHQLYEKIAAEHANSPHPDESFAPRQTASVAAAAAKHASLFRVIAEQHARIAAEREALQQEEEHYQQLEHRRR